MPRVASLVLASLLALPAVAFAADPTDDAAKLYDFTVQATPKVAKGGTGSLTVTIAPKAGAEIHKEAPIKLALKAPAQLTVAKASFGRGDMKMSGASATFDVPFTAAAAGKGSVEADLSFYICTEKLCVRQQRKATADVDVN